MRLKLSYSALLLLSFMFHMIKADQTPHSIHTSTLTRRSHISHIHCSTVEFALISLSLRQLVEWCDVAVEATGRDARAAVRDILLVYVGENASYTGGQVIRRRFQVIRDEAMLSAQTPVNLEEAGGRVMIRCDHTRAVCRPGEVARTQLDTIYIVSCQWLPSVLCKLVKEPIDIYRDTQCPEFFALEVPFVHETEQSQVSILLTALFQCTSMTPSGVSALRERGVSLLSRGLAQHVSFARGRSMPIKHQLCLVD